MLLYISKYSLSKKYIFEKIHICLILYQVIKISQVKTINLTKLMIGYIKHSLS